MIRARLKSGKFYRREGEKGELTRYVKGDIVTFENRFEIPDTFKSQFDLPEVDTSVEVLEETEQEEAPEPTLTIEHRGGGKYNVVRVDNGEAINDELLTKEEALALVDTGLPEGDE